MWNTISKCSTREKDYTCGYCEHYLFLLFVSLRLWIFRPVFITQLCYEHPSTIGNRVYRTQKYIEVVHCIRRLIHPQFKRDSGVITSPIIVLSSNVLSINGETWSCPLGRFKRPQLAVATDKPELHWIEDTSRTIRRSTIWRYELFIIFVFEPLSVKGTMVS